MAPRVGLASMRSPNFGVLDIFLEQRMQVADVGWPRLSSEMLPATGSALPQGPPSRGLRGVRL